MYGGNCFLDRTINPMLYSFHSGWNAREMALLTSASWKRKLLLIQTLKGKLTYMNNNLLINRSPTYCCALYYHHCRVDCRLDQSRELLLCSPVRKKGIHNLRLSNSGKTENPRRNLPLHIETLHFAKDTSLCMVNFCPRYLLYTKSRDNSRYRKMLTWSRFWLINWKVQNIPKTLQMSSNRCFSVYLPKLPSLE